MRHRTLWAGVLVGALLAATATPSLAAKKAKHKPIVGSYTASALPDPTSSNVHGTCKPTLPTGIYRRAFKVPAAGRLHVALANTLDWSLAVTDPDGSDEASSDGSTPTAKESVDVTFRKAQRVSIDACNFSGEPSVKVSYVFTFK